MRPFDAIMIGCAAGTLCSTDAVLVEASLKHAALQPLSPDKSNPVNSFYTSINHYVGQVSTFGYHYIQPYLEERYDRNS